MASEKNKARQVAENRGDYGFRPEYMIGASLALGAIMVCVAIYLGAGNIVNGVNGLQSAGTVQDEPLQQGAPQAAGPNIPSATKEVTVDFLYADWCPHCQNMKPIVEKMIAEFPSDRFAVRYWSEADGQSKPEASAVYAKYSQEGYFTGYPTFVINNGKSYTAGEMSEADFRAYLCSQFGSPKPSNC
jgi:thiol-disulfide isomerase/thioredoxin